MINDENLFYRLGFSGLKGVSPENAISILKDFDNSPSVLFKTDFQTLAGNENVGPDLARQIKDQTWKPRAAQELQFIEQNNIETYFVADSNYPCNLLNCKDAPLLFFSNRKLDFNAKTFVAIVGTRRMTEYGRNLCVELVRSMAVYKDEFVIVSGLAYGVDIMAHRLAMEYGIPTVAVFAHGLDVIYPALHKKDAAKMSDSGGALLTDNWSNTKLEGYKFRERNRIIAGLSEYIIVIESRSGGGAILTGQIGASYNKKVYSFPGKVTDEMSKGCNLLIKSNEAEILLSPDQFVKELESDNLRFKGKLSRKGAVQTNLFEDLTLYELQIVQKMVNFPEGIQINELVILTGTPVFKLSSFLLSLEFKGVVRALPGGIYRLQ